MLWLTDPEIWMALATLTALEIVLGVLKALEAGTGLLSMPGDNRILRFL